MPGEVTLAHQVGKDFMPVTGGSQLAYVLLEAKPTEMMAQVTGVKVGEFVHTFGDVHLYANHFEQARLQLTRPTRALPVMKINPAVKDIFAFRYEDFVLEGYDPHPHIKAAVAV